VNPDRKVWAVPESDGLDETVEQLLRVSVTAAAQLAEHLAHARTQANRQTAQHTARDAQQLAARLEAEQRAGRAQPAGPDTTDDKTHTAAAPDTSPARESPAQRAARADAALLAVPSAANGTGVAAQVETWLAVHGDQLPGLAGPQGGEAVDARLRAELSQGQPPTATTDPSAGAVDRGPAPRFGVHLEPPADLERD
jgi:hypothetical protein